MAESMSRSAMNKAGYSVSVDLRGGPVTVVVIRSGKPFIVTRRSGKEQASETSPNFGMDHRVSFELRGWFDAHKTRCPISAIRAA